MVKSHSNSPGRRIAAMMCLLGVFGLASVCPLLLCAEPATAPSVTSTDLHLVLTHAIDVAGKAHPIGHGDKKSVVIFLGTECPISQRAVATLNALASAYPQIDLVGVVSDPTVSRKAAQTLRDAYAVQFPLIFDASGELAQAIRPTHVPQAFLINKNGDTLYAGRIDDAFIAIGKPSTVVKQHELEDAIRSSLAGQSIAVPRTKPVGCFFEAWNVNTNGAAATTRPAVTYARDVAPILIANCVSCHHPGDVAPFSLTTYTDAAKRAKQLSSVTASRYMPPWKPAEGFGHFKDVRRLTDPEIAVLDAWAQAGAPEGNADDLPAAPVFSSAWALGEPDLIVKMPEPFTIPASGRDIYRAFVAKLDIPQDSYIAGFEFRPDAKSVVHHCILYLDDSGAARALDAKDPEPGYKSFGGPGFTPSGSLGGWAPGATPNLLPEGVGKPVHKGADVVFQMHYHPDGREHTDQSTIAIYLQKKPVIETVASFVLANRDVDIPAGDNHYIRNATFTLPVDTKITGIFPHMHLVGRQMKVTATKPDGSIVPMIDITDWDFRWQDQFIYADPMLLPKGTRFDLEAIYDNSAANPSNPNDPPARVKRGEQTTDEMCLCFVQFQASDPLDIKLIRRAMVTEKLREKFAR